MKTVALGKSGLLVSRLAYGCWRIAGRGGEQDRAMGRKAVLAAYEAGYTLFDHADIYGNRQCETIFGELIKEVSGLKEEVTVATKCGIRFVGDPEPDAPFRYDFSSEHIERSCEGSLKRLGVEAIDLYQLHRPDYLMDPEEVAGAFTRLKDAGKVREFGVSNFRPSQWVALQRCCPMPLVVNQIEISLAHRQYMDDGTLDQCLAEQVTPLAWSPLAGGKLGDGATDVLPWQEDYVTEPYLSALDEIAEKRGATRMVVALAWLLKHPAGIVPIVGSTQPGRIQQAVAAVDTELTREEWYKLLEAAMGERLP